MDGRAEQLACVELPIGDSILWKINRQVYMG